MKRTVLPFFTILIMMFIAVLALPAQSLAVEAGNVEVRLTNLTNNAGSLLALPALALADADIVRDVASGPARCREKSRR